MAQREFMDGLGYLIRRIVLSVFVVLLPNVVYSQSNEHLLSVKLLQTRKTAFDQARGRGPQKQNAEAHRVLVFLFPKGEVLRDGVPPSDAVAMSTSDKKTIGEVADGISRARVSTPRSAKTQSLNEAFGMIRIDYEHSSIRILMAHTFVIELDGEFSDNGVFLSRKLAVAVSDMIKRESGHSLNAKQVDCLSGFAECRSEEEAYHQDQFGKDHLRDRRQTPKTVEKDFSKYKPFVLKGQDDCESLAWGGLEFLRKNGIEGMKVRLGENKPNLGSAPGEWLVVDVNDPLSLRRAHRGLFKSWKSTPSPGIYFGQAPYGMIEFYSKGRTVVIHINGNFHIEYGSETDNGFVSWTLARVLNDVVLRHTGSGLSKTDFGRLSGRHPDFPVPKIDQ